jgi:hypothetical protein
MDRLRPSRKWLPVTCVLVLSACGDDTEKPAGAKAHPTPDSALVDRCSLKVADGDGGFPAGLLPAGAVVTGDGYAIVDAQIADVYQQLQEGAGKAGLTVRDSELETFDAELELEGSDGEFGLALEPRRGCDGATEVRLRG